MPGGANREETIDNEGEFGEWVAPHLRAMGNLAARLAGPSERDDVVQEALTRAWRKRSQFDPERGSPRAWLLAIVADRARRTWRGRGRTHAASSAGFVEGPSEVGIDLERAVASLPPRMRLAVECVYFVDLAIADTAAVMGVSEGTVKSTLSDARARLRTMLEVRDA
jgi:RNA polymerase sigma-70 factor (ECF subfamily)